MSLWSEDLIAVEQAVTLDGLFLQRVHRSPERVAYRHYDRGAAEWRALTWHEMARQVARWRDALAGESVAAGDRVALVLRNCPEWVIFDQAALALGLVTVPLYTDDRPESACYILQDAAVKILMVQDVIRWKRLAAALGERPYPARVVLLESSDEAYEVARRDPRVVVADAWLPAVGMGLEPRAGRPDELATIVYTSGTTGRPKGVMLSHRNILSNTHASLTVIDCYQQDVFLSFLPLSHMLERTGGYYLPMMAGACVAYARSIAQLAEDLQTIRPTALIAVPRIFERIYQRVQEQVATRGRLARSLFGLAVAVGWIAFEHGQRRRGWHPALLLWPFLRRKVAVAVLAKLGGQLRLAVSGGAPLPKDVARLFISLGLPLIQGYGLTETSPVVSVNPLHDNRPDGVGVPVRGVQVRVGDDDELLVKGPNVMLGYWNNHAASANMFDRDGWLRTGDQARIDSGHIYITGRIKDILVLSNGEKVPPADMEMAIAMDPLIEQAIVIGEGRSFLSALLVLNADLWAGLAREYALNPAATESLEDPALIRDMLKRLRDALRDFPGYAKIRRVVLSLEPWSVENGMLTPTMKVKRNEVLRYHAEQIERLYRMEA
ncbi:long-chain fatty acid--CoA ligase [Thioalkalicoccus limnaeus]|uniref:Long-chain fatty acid--CoA ligase n=1 Tax=Thioalkalicoccus limnaeus TaxID=120681 RepID=A0ABV4BDS1_9GAMM